MDRPGLPWDLLLVMLIGAPVCIAVVLGVIEFRIRTPLVFHCRRCQREFRRPAHRDFPPACPRCRSRDWNASP